MHAIICLLLRSFFTLAFMHAYLNKIIFSHFSSKERYDKLRGLNHLAFDYEIFLNVTLRMILGIIKFFH
jgi:hypothetical protein